MQTMFNGHKDGNNVIGDSLMGMGILLLICATEMVCNGRAPCLKPFAQAWAIGLCIFSLNINVVGEIPSNLYLLQNDGY